MKPRLYLMLGSPGAGKTTAAVLIHELTGATHLWADQVRQEMFGNAVYSAAEHTALYDFLNNQAELLLLEKLSVVYDTNFNYYKDRTRLRAIAKKTNAETVLVWVQTPEHIARQRATGGAKSQNTRVLGDMPNKKFDQLINNFEIPGVDEVYITVDGTKVSKEYISQILHL